MFAARNERRPGILPLGSSDHLARNGGTLSGGQVTGGEAPCQGFGGNLPFYTMAKGGSADNCYDNFEKSHEPENFPWKPDHQPLLPSS